MILESPQETSKRHRCPVYPKEQLPLLWLKKPVKVDPKSKLIKSYCVTDTLIADSRMVKDLLEEDAEGSSLYADKAYRGLEALLLRT